MEKHYNTAQPTEAQIRQVTDAEDRRFLDAMAEIEKSRRRNLDRLVQMIESSPELRAKYGLWLDKDQKKFENLDLSALEKVIASQADVHADRMQHPRGNVSPTLRRTSGVTCGVVQRFPIMMDNLPRDGRIKVDVAPGKRIMQTDIYAGNVKTEDLGDALAAFAYGLSGEQLGVIPAESGGGQSTPEHLPLHYLQSERGPIVDFKTTGDPKGPQGSGRALRIRRDSTWSAERRDRAATSASDRKKLRAKTRAQKKARRKQR